MQRHEEFIASLFGFIYIFISYYTPIRDAPRAEYTNIFRLMTIRHDDYDAITVISLMPVVSCHVSFIDYAYIT
jgi:hypothetical protein